MNGPASPSAYLQVGAAFGPMGEIQQTLWARRAPMRDHGVLYVRDYPMEDVHASASLRHDEAALRAMPRAAGAWERVAERARQWPGLTVISHGSFALATEDDVRTAVRSLQPAEVHVVLTTMDLRSQAYAHWHHLLTSGAHQSFADFVDDLTRKVDTREVASWESMQDPVGILDRWSTVVPVERIHVIVAAATGSGYASPWLPFCRVAGIDADLAMAADPVPVTWLHPDDAEVLRRVNGALAGRLRGAPYDRAVRDLFAGAVLSRSPRIPQDLALSADAHHWFAARADETTASLADAGYHIVGDLQDLRPAPEPTAPPAEDDDAGRLLPRTLEASALVLERMRNIRNRVEHAERALDQITNGPEATPKPSDLKTRTTIRVDDDGLVLDDPRPTATLDVLFDGRRIWSLDPQRDGHLVGDHHRVVWPTSMRRFLDGVARVQVREHIGGRDYVDATVSFGSGAGRVQFVDAQGHSLALDKSGVPTRIFAQRSHESRDHLITEVRHALDVLAEQGGVPAYLCYGLLLGAVREGHMIGHDSDGDISYVSRAEHPVGVMQESYGLERIFHRNGWRTRRITGGCFKVMSSTPDGGIIGIDVFASYFIGQTYYLTDFVSGHLAREDLLPIGSVTLEGQEVPAPARPEKLLEIIYGPGWRVPDPAFKFTPTPWTERRMVGWFRYGFNRPWWRDFHARPTEQGTSPTDFAVWSSAQMDGGKVLIDAGCGPGGDAIWLAQHGYRVTGFDYAANAVDRAAHRARAASATAEFHQLNFYDTRATLVTAAQLARADPRADVIYARWLLDSLTRDGRSNFLTFASMVLQGVGGRLVTEVRLVQRPRALPRQDFPGQWQAQLSMDQLREEIAERGGSIEYEERLPAADSADKQVPPRCRLVVRWST